MTTDTSRESSERGASLVLITASMLLLIGFAALALDAAGLGFNERRQHQSAADVGSLAAVQFAVPRSLGNAACGGYSGATLARCNGAVEAIEVANATLDDPSLADWSDASRCATPPVGFTTSPISNCVAFLTGNQRAWVHIPLVDKPTTFAGVIGFNSIGVTAEAIAGTSIGTPGAVLPFLLPGNAAGTDYNCLKSAGTPNFGECADLPSTGNFGTMDFFLYGNADFGYTSRCSGDENGRFAANLARGIDHPLGIHPTGAGSGKLDQANCPEFSAEPDMARAQPGVGSQASFEAGMLYGGTAYSATPYDGRLEDASGYQVRNSQGPNAAVILNNEPLWNYLLADPPGTACDGVDTPAEMLNCIAWAKSTSTVVFKSGTDGLVTAQRYGWTPAVWEDDFGTPSTDYHIKGYTPVYLDTTLFGCNSNRCNIIHTPGVSDNGSCPNNPASIRITCGTPGAGSNNLLGATAYILSADIVPDEAKTPSPGSPNQRNFRLVD